VKRSVLVLAHTGRRSTARAARHAVARLQQAGIEVRAVAEEAADLDLTDVRVCDESTGAADGAELVLVLGGDGSILRAAELARESAVPLLGVNLGPGGLPGRGEQEDLEETLERVLDRDYTVEPRSTLDVDVLVEGAAVDRGWALNECSVEKAARERMLELVVEVDGRPLSRWGCDGVVASTPPARRRTPSRPADPWSGRRSRRCCSSRSARTRCSPAAGRGPGTVVGARGAGQRREGGRGLRRPPLAALPHGARVEVRTGSVPVLLARTRERTFTDTLVRKFALPVDGWRGARERG
jgi:NAD+ kinase